MEQFEFVARISWCDSLVNLEMDFNLRLEYALEGSSNYIEWKDRMEVVLEGNGLKEFINSDVPKPTSMDVALLDAWKNKVAKTRRILLEGLRDHIVSSLHGNPLHLQCGRL